MSEHGVIIVGGGPAGMMLAAELALANVDVAIVERRSDHVLADARAGGIHARTVEVLDQRGVAERFIEPAVREDTAGAWRRAYERQPATEGDRAAARLAASVVYSRGSKGPRR